MKKSPKGQTSTEYIIVLSFVIAIALVFLSLTMSMPNRMSREAGSSNGYWVNSQIAIDGIYVYDNETKIYIRNNLRMPIEIKKVKFGDTTISFSSNLSVVPSGYAAVLNSSSYTLLRSPVYPSFEYSVNGSEIVREFSNSNLKYFPTILN